MHWRLALVLILPAALSGCTQFWTGEIDPVPAPDFNTVDTEGNPVNLTDFPGPVVLDFMGTWCTECRRAVPGLLDLQAAYPNMTLLSISATDTTGQINDFKAQHGADWIHIRDDGTIVNAYLEAGSNAGSMLWPSYAIVVDGELIFYNRGATQPATFAVILDDHLGRNAPPVSSDAAVPILIATMLGALAWVNPWTAPIVAEEPRRRRVASILLPLILFGLLGAVAGWASRPLTGRIPTASSFIAAAGIGAILFWRLRGAKTPQGKRIDADDWRHDVSLHGNMLWYGLPAWSAILHAALLRTAPVESFLMVAAFGVGIALMDVAVQRGLDVRLRSLGERAGWLGAIAFLIGGLWNGALYVLR
ncbi:MAG: TlpA family protein disulfide reductase [Thermoplasmatota archaeon]